MFTRIIVCNFLSFAIQKVGIHGSNNGQHEHITPGRAECERGGLKRIKAK